MQSSTIESIDAVGIERLRASRERVAQADHDSSYECGQYWALQKAEYDELRRVALMDTDSLPDDDSGGAAYDLSVAILGDTSPDHSDVSDTLESIFDTSVLYYADVVGFIKGAAEVYARV